MDKLHILRATEAEKMKNYIQNNLNFHIPLIVDQPFIMFCGKKKRSGKESDLLHDNSG